MKIKFFPSLLSADFGHLQNDIKRVEDFVDGFHFDVMDGHFVSNISVGPVVLKSLNSKKPFDVHLMIQNPDKYLESFIASGANQLSVHIETLKNPQNTLKKIKDKKIPAGIVFNPQTPLDLSLCEIADFVLIMSVNPGFGGQKFITNVLDKVIKIRKTFPQKNIQLDGGINAETFQEAIKSGANWIVSGSYFWQGKDLQQIAQDIKYPNF